MTPDNPVSGERWIASLAALAAQRGAGPACLERAVTLCRQLGISPWIALAVAEGKVRLADAAALDRAAKCKQLQSAILDKGLTLEAVRTTLPYAPYFLAAELQAALRGALPRMSAAVALAAGLLKGERAARAGGAARAVRRRPFEDYRAQAERILELQRREALDLDLAIEVATGGLDPRLAARTMELRRGGARPRNERRRSFRGPAPDGARKRAPTAAPSRAAAFRRTPRT
jgi:hypothetical protein